MGTSGRRRAVALIVALGLFAWGCWGYNNSAKRGAYVLDTVMVLGGGGLITLGVMNPPRSCASIEMDTGIPNPACHDPVAGPLSGTLVTGALLAVGGLAALLGTRTTTNVMTSRKSCAGGAPPGSPAP